MIYIYFFIQNLPPVTPSTTTRHLSFPLPMAPTNPSPTGHIGISQATHCRIMSSSALRTPTIGLPPPPGRGWVHSPIPDLVLSPPPLPLLAVIGFSPYPDLGLSPPPLPSLVATGFSVPSSIWVSAPLPSPSQRLGSFHLVI